MWIKKKYQIQEASTRAGVEQHVLLTWIQNEWILPEQQAAEELDEEDIARARLIHNLIADFGVNDEGVSIVLHLLDQLHVLQKRIQG